MIRKHSLLFVLLILLAACLFPAAAAAQQTYPAKGTLDDSENSLWIYYKGKTKQTVKRNAPMFEKLNDSSKYLLDYKKIKGVELYLFAEFKDNKLALLQILTPFPEYDKCSRDTKDTSRQFAEVAKTMMGVSFEKNQCSQSNASGTPYICLAEDYACVYQLCPGTSWSYTCSLTK